MGKLKPSTKTACLLTIAYFTEYWIRNPICAGHLGERALLHELSHTQEIGGQSCFEILGNLSISFNEKASF
jgi:hypothetical protein